MPIDLINFLAAFGLGFFGGVHCIGMCGGIMSALSFAIPESKWQRRLAILLSYNFGRIATYTLMGAIVGSAGTAFSGDGHGLNIFRILAAVLLIAMGLYIGNWWHGLRHLEKVGQYLWRFLQPIAQRLLPVASPLQAVLLGSIWGWLPCGLIYSVLVYAAAQATPIGGALTMLAFGLGTLPAVLAGGLMAQGVKSLLRGRAVRSIFACAVIGFGVWTLLAVVGPFSHAGHSGHAGHAGHGSHQHEAQHEHHHHTHSK